MTTVKARFDGRVFVPETPVELPVGSVVEILLPLSPPLPALAEIAHQFPDDPDMPADAAAPVDFYLYGTPTLADGLAGRTGRICSGDKARLSENGGERFTEGLK